MNKIPEIALGMSDSTILLKIFFEVMIPNFAQRKMHAHADHLPVMYPISTAERKQGFFQNDFPTI